MDFGLGVIANIEQEKSDIIHKLSSKMESFFSSKNYGDGIKSFTIGIVCITPQFEQFFKNTRPKYTKGKQVISPDGISIVLENNFEYGIRLNYDEFIESDEKAAMKILSREIILSFPSLEDIMQNIPHFDFVEFKNDFVTFLEENLM